MSQKIFGAGLIWVTPQTDSLGNPIANPTPVQIGTLQEGTVDISFEQKFLYGSDSKFPKAVAQGKGSINGKAKFGEIKSSILSSVLFGQATSDGLQSINYDTLGVAIPDTGTLTPSVPNSGKILDDLGVVFKASGLPLKRVAANPKTGEYSVDTVKGTYTFAVADKAKIVFVTYSYTADVAGAQKGTVVAQPMGYTPKFSLDLYLPYDGKSLILHLYACVGTKLSLATKLDDFTYPEFDFSAFADASGNVMDYSMSE